MASTVTINRKYFETLLRRAKFHASGRDLSTPIDLPVITIPKVDHDNLLRAAQEYDVLKKALYQGGIEEETLEVLIRGGGSAQAPEATSEGPTFELSSGFEQHEHQPADSPSRLSSSAFQPNTQGSSLRPWSGGNNRPTSFRQNSSNIDENSYYAPDGAAADALKPSTPNVERPQYARNDQRSIVLKNLSDKVTHKDIVGAIRGGTVLDVYLRQNERCASVSFVEGSAAAAFLAHTKRNDIYLHGKRVEIGWNDRQFILPSHVAAKISTGGSRNLIIRSVHPDITGERIREDLDHIHNLAVVDLTFANKDALVSLNSVHNALFARTCLMSRGRYKGVRIDFFPDECAQPLPVPQRSPLKPNTRPDAKRNNSMRNRFQMLNMDGTEDESTNSDGSSEVAKFVPKTWTASTVAV